MGKTKRRSEKQIVEVLLNHLAKVKGVVSQRELCSEVGINPKTVSKWLFLFQLIKNQCPDFRYELNGQSPIIIRPHFSGSRDEVKTQIHQFLDVHGIKMSELRKECVNLISEEIESESIGYEQKQLSVPRVTINEFKQELADALARGMDGLVSVNPKDLEVRISEKTMTEFKQELADAVARGMDGLIPVNPRELEVMISEEVIAEFKKELNQVLNERVKGF